MRDAMDRLVAEIQRLRRLKPIPTDRASVLAHIRSEIGEVEREQERTDKARQEAADVLGIAVHMCLIEGIDPTHALELTITKLGARLDLVEGGLTWNGSKELVP